MNKLFNLPSGRCEVLPKGQWGHPFPPSGSSCWSLDCWTLAQWQGSRNWLLHLFLGLWFASWDFRSLWPVRSVHSEHPFFAGHIPWCCYLSHRVSLNIITNSMRGIRYHQEDLKKNERKWVRAKQTSEACKKSKLRKSLIWIIQEQI
jgi:hypothetical protein